MANNHGHIYVALAQGQNYKTCIYMPITVSPIT